MDEEISIIDSKTRNEKIKNFFIENKRIIILIITILVVAIVSFYSFQAYKDAKRESLSDKFNTAVIEFDTNNKSETVLSLSEIVEYKDSTYSPLALYFIIDNNLIESKTEINRLFDILINKTNLEKEIRYLIIYKKALYNADTINENELLDIIKPVLNSESVWKSHALYLVAEYFYSKNEKQKSKDFFSKIISTENVNEDILKEAQKRLNRDLSE
tara:strand:+ start:66 stop:710 length:645 start_codon:yes stop_codon:yes gene_type:complete